MVFEPEIDLLRDHVERSAVLIYGEVPATDYYDGMKLFLHTACDTIGEHTANILGRFGADDMALQGAKPEWLTFDCYGTLIQWDEGLLATVEQILAGHGGAGIDPDGPIEVYDKHEHGLEQTPPHRSFREVAGTGLRRAMEELGLVPEASDIEILTSSISAMPPFSEVVDALGDLKAGGFKLCIISNTDDDIIEGNVAQLGAHIPSWPAKRRPRPTVPGDLWI